MLYYVFVLCQGIFTDCTSGAMLLFTLSPQVLSSRLVIFITSVTLATATLPFSIARPTLRPANSPVSLTSKRLPMTRRNGSRKTNTGLTLTKSRRMVSVADAAATLTLSMLRASKAAVSTNGWTWLVAGPRHRS